jgi:hypothetical protein
MFCAEASNFAGDKIGGTSFRFEIELENPTCNDQEGILIRGAVSN